MGVVLEVFDWDWKEAEREFKRAIELNANFFDSHYEYGFLLARLKRLDEAERELEKSLQIDPLSVRGHQILGLIYGLKGDLKKAEEQNRWSDELNPRPDFSDTSVEVVQKLMDRDGRVPLHLRRLALIYIGSGQPAEARKLLKELERLYKESDVGNIALCVAAIYGSLEDIDQALIWLERSHEKRDPLLISLNIASFYDSLRDDPRFLAILAKMDLE